MKNKGNLILYRDQTGDMHIDVRLEDETVWLSQKQMARLFNKSPKTISHHIKNVFDEGELKRSEVFWEYQEPEAKESESDFFTQKQISQIPENEGDRTISKYETVAQSTKDEELTEKSESDPKVVAATRPPTVRKFLIPRMEGNREIEREVEYYSLDVIISVGYRVKSLQGTQFRIWATQRLREYITKGFVINDAQLAEGRTTQNYFEELLDRVRDIRTSERNFYRKVLDLFATSADYDPSTDYARKFFAVVQNKFHYAITGMTATEIIKNRCDHTKVNMGLTNWKGKLITRNDAQVAKNYLMEIELKRMNLLVEQFLSYAELQILEKKVIYMVDWIKKLDQFLHFNEKAVLSDSGSVSRKEMETQVRLQLKKFNETQKSA